MSLLCRRPTINIIPTDLAPSTGAVAPFALFWTRRAKVFFDRSESNFPLHFTRPQDQKIGTACQHLPPPYPIILTLLQQQNNATINHMPPDRGSDGMLKIWLVVEGLCERCTDLFLFNNYAIICNKFRASKCGIGADADEKRKDATCLQARPVIIEANAEFTQ